jgi:hypothetical protein
VLSRRHRLLTGIGVGAGGIWAIIQLLYTSVALSQNRQERLDCGVDASEAALSAITLGVCAAALLALVAAVWRRPALVYSLLGVEAVLVAAWTVLEGPQAASCAIE